MEIVKNFKGEKRIEDGIILSTVVYWKCMIGDNFKFSLLKETGATTYNIID